MINNNSNDPFQQLGGSFLTQLWEALLDERNERSKKLAFAMFILLLTYAGVDAVKAIFRKNFGRKGIDNTKLMLSAAAFLAIAIFSLSNYFDYVDEEKYTAIGSQSSMLITSVFYLFLTIYIVYNGWQKSDQVIDPHYRGDSIWFSFLISAGWTPAKVQNLAEPLTLMAIGVFLVPINLYLGLPLVFCALSYWGHMVYEYVKGVGILADTLSNEGHDYSRKTAFSKVIHD